MTPIREREWKNERDLKLIFYFKIFLFNLVLLKIGLEKKKWEKLELIKIYKFKCKGFLVGAICWSLKVEKCLTLCNHGGFI